jgi:hypothetical protein
VARKPGAPRRPRISRNPLRGGCRLCRLPCCCLRAQRCSLLSTQGHGCGQHPAFPAPSVLGGTRFPPDLGRIAPREGVVARKAKTRFRSEICGSFLKWLGNLDSNQDKQSQSLLCYRYTIPQWISEQFQWVKENARGVRGCRSKGQINSSTPASFYLLAALLGKRGGHGVYGGDRRPTRAASSLIAHRDMHPREARARLPRRCIDRQLRVACFDGAHRKRLRQIAERLRQHGSPGSLARRRASCNADAPQKQGQGAAVFPHALSRITER